METRLGLKPLGVLATIMLWLVIQCGAQPPAKLRRQTLTPQLAALLPADFQVMPDDAIATKYPSPRKPLAAYTSPSGQVDFVVSQKTTPFKAKDLGMLLRFYKANILNMYGDNVQFAQEQVVTINDTEFIALEFNSALTSTAKEGNTMPKPAGQRGSIRRYTYLLYTILPPKSEKELPQLLSFTFACPSVLADKWRPVAQQVMASVKIKK
jgi:hypothetical protein